MGLIHNASYPKSLRVRDGGVRGKPGGKNYQAPLRTARLSTTPIRATVVTMNRSLPRRVIGIGAWLLALVAASAAPPAQWVSRGPGGGGSMFAPSFSPYNSSEFFMACDMTPLFHTTTLGAAWQTIDFRQIEGNRNAIVQFTSDPLVLYGLDYTSLGGGDTVRPTKSTDGGATWQPIPGDPTGAGAFSLFADINTTNRLVVADYSSVYFSGDGGVTFAQKFSTNGPNGCLVGGVFFDGSNVFVGTGVGLVVSTNSGSTFALANVGGIPATQAIFSFTGAKQGGVTRFVAATLASGSVYPGVAIEGEYANFGGIYTLDWGQPNWVLRTTGIGAGNYPVFVAMCLTNLNTAYCAGQNSAGTPVVFKTINGGTNWNSVLFAANNQNIFTGWDGAGGDQGWTWGAGPMGFAVGPFDANQAGWTDMGYCHITTNGGATWMQRYVDPADQNPTNAPTPMGRHYHGVGLEVTSCWDLGWAGSNQIFAAYTDIKGALSTNGGSAWSFGYTGHSLNTMYRIIRHPASGVLYAATASVHDLFQSTYLQDARIDGGSGLLLYSTNNGNAWQTLDNAGHVMVWVESDPTNPNRLYASLVHSNYGGIYVSTNVQNTGTSTWVKMTTPPRTEGHPYNIRVLNDGTVVCSYSGRRDGAGAFTASSGFFMCTNPAAATAVWLDRSDPNMQYWTKDVVLNPYDSGQSNWFACVFNGWGGPPNNKGGLYRTLNRGQTWTQLAGNALAPSGILNVDSCAFSPINSNEFYFSTELDGLWCSTNISATAPSFFAVTNYPFSHPLRLIVNPYNSNEVWVTSFGNGLRVGTYSSAGVLAPIDQWRQLHFGANATNTAIAGDLADPDGDGIPNLLEYALNLDPLVASVAGLPVCATTNVSGANFLTLSYTQVKSATDITYIVESAGVPAGAWTTNVTPVGITDQGATQTMTYRDNIAMSAAPARFMHLRVTHP